MWLGLTVRVLLFRRSADNKSRGGLIAVYRLALQKGWALYKRVAVEGRGRERESFDQRA